MAIKTSAKYLLSFKLFCGLSLLLSYAGTYATAPPTSHQSIKSNHHSLNTDSPQEPVLTKNTKKPSNPVVQQHPLRLTPKPYKTEYVGKYKGMRITSSRNLEVLGQSVYQLSTKINSMLIKISEVSTFTLHVARPSISTSIKDASEQKSLYPLSYRYSKKGIGKNKHSDLSFDWGKHLISNNDKSNKWTIDLIEGTQDKLSLLQQLRRNLLLTDGKFNISQLNVVKDARIKQYRFEQLSEEIVHTELGYFDTIKIRQFRKDRDRQTIYWFAKRWDYILIKVRHEEKPGKGNDVLLIRGELAGQPIRGRKSE